MNAVNHVVARARIFDPAAVQEAMERKTADAAFPVLAALVAGYCLFREFPQGRGLVSDCVHQIRLFWIRFPEASHEFVSTMHPSYND